MFVLLLYGILFNTHTSSQEEMCLCNGQLPCQSSHPIHRLNASIILFLLLLLESSNKSIGKRQLLQIKYD